MNSPETLTLPAAVDMHVHLREPGQEEKETFQTGTQAAAAGGVTTVVAMPNLAGRNRVNSLESVVRARGYARPPAINIDNPPSPQVPGAGRGVWVDTGFYYASGPLDDNIGSFERVIRLVHGVKFMINVSQGNDELLDPKDFAEYADGWSRVAAPTQPIIVHAEDNVIEETLAVVRENGDHNLHVAHVSSEHQLQTIMNARERGQTITCETSVDYLWQTDERVRQQGWLARRKPPLASERDQNFLWENIDHIDVLASDHAPHEHAEKQRVQNENPTGEERAGHTCYGTPGLEVTMPLMVQAMLAGAITQEKLISMTRIRPAEILGLRLDSRDQVTYKLGEYRFGIDDHRTFSKADYAMYEGMLMVAKVVETTLHGEVIFRDGQFVNNHGMGEVLRPTAY